MYELNKDTRVIVWTVGDTDKIDVNETVEQGSIKARVISSNSLGNGVEDYFETSDSDLHYGPIRLLPQSYQDDLFRFLEDPLAAELGNERFENLADSKCLQYNHSKSAIIVLGRKKEREKMEKMFEANPPLHYGKQMNIEKHGTWLGEEIGGSLSDCIT